MMLPIAVCVDGFASSLRKTTNVKMLSKSEKMFGADMRARDYEHTLLNQDIDFHRFARALFNFNGLPQLGQTMVPISLNREQ